MAYDEGLAERIREVLSAREGVGEREMFGGICFMVAGNMACGVNGDDLIARIGPEAAEAALGEVHVSDFDLTGRPMRAWVMVAAEGVASDEDLARWVAAGADFAASLPPK
ncbi:MAG: TfoX/Sxy family protein [Solirubrobacterales bacterium]